MIFIFILAKSATNKAKTSVVKWSNGKSLLPSSMKMKRVESLKLNDVVLCKIKGHPEWPCRVIGIEGNLFQVEFFGDHTTHKTIIDNFLDISESYEIMIYHLRRLKTPLYRKSFRKLIAPPYLNVEIYV